MMKVSQHAPDGYIERQKMGFENEKSLIWCCYVYRKRQSIPENGGERGKVRTFSMIFSKS
ncbi:hypothetical protein [uncultured Roseibium sp.]|uniref:hypothetical protein n=1 Tax=uncultured Roseibium sp. TaxID=1936171 RepID=UPI0026123D3B|nr:hypothetical protein [uncultured Roseibium sp.]